METTVKQKCNLAVFFLFLFFTCSSFFFSFFYWCEEVEWYSICNVISWYRMKPWKINWFDDLSELWLFMFFATIFYKSISNLLIRGLSCGISPLMTLHYCVFLVPVSVGSCVWRDKFVSIIHFVSICFDFGHTKHNPWSFVRVHIHIHIQYSTINL